ncbi:dehydrogenase/reductase SDR family protein 7 [Acrasis kona]|uniref:Dehydrogenase/reductase SDR family protein 7 n=1 Tax=Acrasis kona TaxID=1008807 RepID=A0AAW2YY33_9EUKA
MFILLTYLFLLFFFVYVVSKATGLLLLLERKIYDVRHKENVNDEGKVVVVTGASSGIGMELARVYSKRKSKIVVAARRLSNLEELKKTCLDLGASEVLCIECDVSIEEDCKNLISKSVEKFGDRIDYLYLSAGVGLDQPFSEAKDLSNYKAIMDINYYGAIGCTLHALPYLTKSNGHICVVSSLQGKFALPQRCGYSASKHAVNGFFNSLRVEMKGQIKVTIVCPGYVWTEFQNSRLSTGDTREVIRNKSKFMTVEQCVKETMEAVKYNEHEYIMTTKGKLGVVAQAILPQSWIDYIATSSSKNAQRK